MCNLEVPAQVMIHKPDSLKLTCDPGKKVNATKVQSNPISDRVIMSAIWKSYNNNILCCDLETKFVKVTCVCGNKANVIHMQCSITLTKDYNNVQVGSPSSNVS